MLHLFTAYSLAFYASGSSRFTHSRDQLTQDEKSQIFENLVQRLSDEGHGVRSKSIRSLGKMARFNLLDRDQTKRLRAIVDRTLGIDESYQWDRAYIVRKEAQQILDFLKSKQKA